MTHPTDSPEPPRVGLVNHRLCTAQRCAEPAVDLCPGCGMALCAACLARHARFPGVVVSARRQWKERKERQP